MDDKDIIEELQEITRSTIYRLDELWDEIGIDSDVKLTRKKTVVQHVTDLYQDMIKEIEHDKERIERDIDDCIVQLNELSANLQCDISLPEETTLIDMRNKLQRRVEKFTKISEERKAELKELETKQRSLCKALGKECKEFTKSPLPSAEEIQKIKTYIEELSDIKFRREEMFLQKKSVILEIMEELQYKPTLNSEKMIVGEDSAFQVTDENMEALDDFHNNITKRKEEVVSKIAELRETVTGLWELLEESPEVRSDFLNKHPGNSLLTLEALKKEIVRCQEKKKENIKFFVEKLREELETWWKKCRYSPSQRASFLYFDSDCYTEDLLMLHEIEIERLKEHYEKNRNIYELIEKREQLWDQMIDLEQRANRPDRYKNRGGQLLMEEKERNKIRNKLPKIEQNLLDLVEKYEAETGDSFLVCGNRLSDIIAQAWEEHREKKHLLLSAKKQMRENTRLLTPCKSRMGQTHLQLTATPRNGQTHLQVTNTPRTHLQVTATTPMHAMTATKKRKLCTPSFSPPRSKIMRNGLKTAPPKIKVSAPTVRRASLERKKRIEKRQSRMHMESSTASIVSNYNEFEEDLHAKPSCRSSLFHTKLAVQHSSNQKKMLTPHKMPLRNVLNTPQRSTSSLNLRSKSPIAGGSKLTAAPGGESNWWTFNSTESEHF